MTDTLLLWLLIGILIIFFIFFFFSLLFVVQQQKIMIVERFGKFYRLAHPGLGFKIPFVDKLVGEVSLRLTQLDVNVETKTKDDVFTNIIVSVQYRVLNHKAYEAFYTLDDPEKQIQAFVFDIVRARVPTIKLDDVFSSKNEIADSIQEELKGVMEEFGFNILKALVTDIRPDSKVKAAMNEINEAQRLRIAATERGEAEKILKIKQAEAEAESKILQGKGIAGQRMEIINGLRESVAAFQHSIDGTNTKDVMNIVLMSQYFDTLKEMSVYGKTNTILFPHSPSGVHDLSEQIRNFIVAHGQEKMIDAKRHSDPLDQPGVHEKS